VPFEARLLVVVTVSARRKGISLGSLPVQHETPSPRVGGQGL
jgi:hypothetical protein